MSSYKGMFKKIAPAGTIEVTLADVHIRSPQPVVLIMRHAGESNAAYMNARRKIDNHLRTTIGDPSDADFRAALIPVFAETVIDGWKNALRDDGAPIPCTPQEMIAFLTELNVDNGDLVERAMKHAMNASLFRQPMGTAEALGNG